MSDDIKKLEMRITELESQLKQYQAPPAVPDISAAEMKAFLKVSTALSSADIWECGVNECRPVTPFRLGRGWRVPRLPRPCTYECYCGPCNPGTIAPTRFEGFGD
jgi:hypothetical protein